MMIRPPSRGAVPSSIGAWVNRPPFARSPALPLNPVGRTDTLPMVPRAYPVPTLPLPATGRTDTFPMLPHGPIPHPQLPNHTLVPVHVNDLQRIYEALQQQGPPRY